MDYAFFEVRPEYLNIIQTIFGFKGLMQNFFQRFYQNEFSSFIDEYQRTDRQTQFPHFFIFKDIFMRAAVRT
jgi:hypothetical protein